MAEGTCSGGARPRGPVFEAAQVREHQEAVSLSDREQKRTFPYCPHQALPFNLTVLCLKSNHICWPSALWLAVMVKLCEKPQSSMVASMLLVRAAVLLPTSAAEGAAPRRLPKGP